MRFGISLTATVGREGATLATNLSHRIEMVRTARKAGFQVVSAGHHIGAADVKEEYIHPQPLPFLARLAPEGPGMVFQTGVLLGPFYNPVMLAEEAALLAAITGDRFRASIGLGYRDKEFAIFGQKRSDRLKRVVELITTTRRLLRNETVTTTGGFYPLDEVRLTPGSVGDSPPPLTIGTGSEVGARRAGRIADGLYLPGYLPPSGVEGLVEVYRQAAAESERDLPPIVTLRREVTIASSRAAALERSGPGWIRTLSKYLSRGLETPGIPKVLDDLKASGDSPDLPFIVGTAKECAERIRSYEQAGVDELVIRFDLADASEPGTLEAIEQFGEEVIPLVDRT